MDRKRGKLARIVVSGLLIGAVVLGALYLERARRRRVDRDRRCIVEETLVTTPSGPVRIESIEPGDEVLSRSASRASVVSRVQSTRRLEVESFLRFSLSNGAILEVSSWHPVASGGGFQEAGTLGEGVVVELLHGRAFISSRQLVRQRVRVYDLTVSPYENFFAGGVLVNNKSIADLNLPARTALYYLTRDLSFAGYTLPRPD